MGTLGQYLRNAREARNIDIRDAAQQTRISVNYLKALEEEDFAKLPGPVFVRGFLKSYARFLDLDDAETLKRFTEATCTPAPAATPASPVHRESEQKEACPAPPSARRKIPIEPFVWAGIICIALLVFLFTSLPSRHARTARQSQTEHVSSETTATSMEASPTPAKPEKLYLEVVAAEDTWLLVRTDTSPQKKAVLKKGESLIWSADDRFILSYGRVDAVKLLLNGEELTVQGSKDTPVRDLAITRTGIVNQPVPAKQPQLARPKPKKEPPVQQLVQPAVEQAAPAQPEVQQPTAPAASPTPAPAPAPARGAAIGGPSVLNPSLAPDR
jgi:cytoskeletal protein RodZ